ncbi:hypothetical protein H0H92_004729 [Tricholoma furcatifolium]|nr:hypothetical protein H0H92_004729 [Tricholoma furcatifolium]
MSHTPAPGLPPASGTLPTDQDGAYAWLHALEQGLTTSNLSQQALSQQISVVQAQLEELLAAVGPTHQAASHSPTTIPDTPSDLPLDLPGSEPLPVIAGSPSQFESSHPSKIHPPVPPAPVFKLAVRWLPTSALLQALVPPVCIPAAPVAASKLSMGVPMDINTAHCKGPLPTSVYHCCSKPSHWAQDCPEGFDVCYLSSDERGVLIAELLAARVLSPEISMEPLKEVAELAEEDF